MLNSRIVSALGALLMCCVSGHALADRLPGSTVFIGRADAVIAAQRERGELLPVSDPRVRALVATANEKTVFGGAAASAQDFAEVNDVLQRTVTIVGAYAMAGTDARDPGAAKPGQAESILQNMRKYDDVMSPMLAFAFTCSGHFASTLAAMAPGAQGPDRARMMAAIQQYRQSASHMFTGLLMMMPRDTQQSAAHHIQLVTAAGDAAPAVAESLTPAMRRDLYFKAVRAAAFADAAEAGAFEKMKQAFAGTACVGLCAYGE
ncbi:MAG: hypothetical protein ABWX83_00360 [Luteibacter sp.]